MRTVVCSVVVALVIGLAVPGMAVEADMIVLPVIIRDFRSSHPDFEYRVSGVEEGIAAPTLGSDRKPVWSGKGGNSVTTQANFDQWYRDVKGVNQSVKYDLALAKNASTGMYEFSDSSFFPIDGRLLGNEGRDHNYHFTLEMHLKFTYQGGEVFAFRGDDDLWVFIDDRLVLDLGGVHAAAIGSIALDDLDLIPGKTYPFDLFYAERHTAQSNLHLTTSLDLREAQYRTGGRMWLFLVPLVVLVVLLLILLVWRRKYKQPKG